MDSNDPPEFNFRVVVFVFFRLELFHIDRFRNKTLSKFNFTLAQCDCFSSGQQRFRTYWVNFPLSTPLSLFVLICSLCLNSWTRNLDFAWGNGAKEFRKRGKGQVSCLTFIWSYLTIASYGIITMIIEYWYDLLVS